jgi:hypothetical protein
VYRGFNLNIANKDSFDSWYATGQADKIQKALLQSSDLSDYLDGQAINGTRVKAGWFANHRADVFLSHSHADQELAIGIAGFLKKELGISAFIDSLVWGEANTLLKKIDSQYCWMNNKKEYYDYNKRNYSTSHVHMMLGTALAEMIDRCECIIFVNTPQSIHAKDSEKGAQATTSSPWIYHELSTTKLLRRHSERRRNLFYKSQRATTESLTEDQALTLQVNYEVPLSHLKPLNEAQLKAWAQANKKGAPALDWLYDHHAPNEEERLLLPY